MHHGGALGVPTRAPLAPGTLPHRLAGLGRLPEGKVEWVALLVVGLDAGAHLELVHIAARDGAIAGVASHGEVDVAVAGRIGVPLLDESLDHLDHRGNLLRGARANVGVEHAKPVHLLDEGVGELARDLLGRTPLLICAVDDLVVHVREVLGKRHLIALVGEVTPDDVEGKEGAAVAHVNLVVDGGAADIHANLAGLDGRELLLLVRLAVIDEHGYSFVLSWDSSSAIRFSRRPTCAVSSSTVRSSGSGRYSRCSKSSRSRMTLSIVAASSMARQLRR